MSQQFILIGHPVAHSVSPVIHQAAYDELGMDARYGLEDCADEEAVLRQVEKIRSGELAGANVTVPWKKVAFDAADEWDQSAEDVGVANVLCRTPEGKIRAYNTDAMGLASDLIRAAKRGGLESLDGTGALIIGSGGATRASVVACKMAGVERVGVTARRFDPAKPRSSWPNAAAFEGLGAELLAWPTFEKDSGDGEVAKFTASSSLIVQATSAGMAGTQGGEELAELMPFEHLSKGIAYDLVYIPVVTPFMARAKANGVHAEGGLGMLVGQAAHAIEIWTGKLPGRTALHQAAQKALGL